MHDRHGDEGIEYDAASFIPGNCAQTIAGHMISDLQVS
jgi:hypothetical protein